MYDITWWRFIHVVSKMNFQLWIFRNTDINIVIKNSICPGDLLAKTMSMLRRDSSKCIFAWLKRANEVFATEDWRNDPFDNHPTGCLQPTGLLYLIFPSQHLEIYQSKLESRFHSIFKVLSKHFCLIYEISHQFYLIVK